MATHELKIWPEFFDPVARGEKTFDVRYNDRGFEKGDVLWLREWNPAEGVYTGRSVERLVAYVHPGSGPGRSSRCAAWSKAIAFSASSRSRSRAMRVAMVARGARKTRGRAAHDPWRRSRLIGEKTRMSASPHIDIMREVAAAHGLTRQELRAADCKRSRYEARREAARRLSLERKLNLRVIARFMRRNHSSIVMMLDNEKRARKNQALRSLMMNVDVLTIVAIIVLIVGAMAWVK
jgi:hypothetical protein